MMDTKNMITNTMNCHQLDRNQMQNFSWNPYESLDGKKIINKNLTFANSMSAIGQHHHEDDDNSNQRKKPSSRDPLSHRIIEKRRRDRMNNCLADLSRLIPTSYLKKSTSLQGRGRIEKTEIIEMTIKHLKHLQSHKYCNSEGNCELSNGPNLDHEEKIKQFRLGYQECLSEAVRFLVEIEGLYTGDGLCRRIMDHLQDHITSFTKNSHESKSPKPIEEKMDQDTDDFGSWNQQPRVITSQLREMLEHGSNRKPNCYSKNDSNIQNNNSSKDSVLRQNFNNNMNEVYNFKKEIKDRFQADQKTQIPDSMSKKTIVDDERCERGSDSSLSSNRSDTSSGYHSNSSKSPMKTTPIFALHPSGNFYVPSTVDTIHILPSINQTNNVHNILHPINIMVNFSSLNNCFINQELNCSTPILPSYQAPMSPAINERGNQHKNLIIN